LDFFSEIIQTAFVFPLLLNHEYTVTCPLKARIVEPENMSTATDTHATIKVLLEVAFSVGSMLRLYTGKQT
jgi:hypothetical protein